MIDNDIALRIGSLLFEGVVQIDLTGPPSCSSGVRSSDGTLEVVVAFGGFLGFKRRPIAVPVDAMVLLGEVMEVVAYIPDQLRQFRRSRPPVPRPFLRTAPSGSASPSLPTKAGAAVGRSIIRQGTRRRRKQACNFPARHPRSEEHLASSRWLSGDARPVSVMPMLLLGVTLVLACAPPALGQTVAPPQEPSAALEAANGDLKACFQRHYRADVDSTSYGRSGSA